MDIGIAIPCYDKHVIYLNRLLGQLNKSKTPPKQVSISCSGIGSLKFENEYLFDLKVYTTSNYKNVSMNRNIAASQLETDIISFIDSDDLPHIDRNTFILKAFEMGATSVAHNYLYTSIIDDSFLSLPQDEFIFYKDYINSPGLVYPTGKSSHKDYHSAHLSIHKSIFDNYKYNELEIFKYREDSEYANRLVKNGINISYIENKLSIYTKN